jgi:hypothetical protein
VTEPEFVFLEEPLRKSVRIRVEGSPHRRRMLALVLVVAAVGVAVAVIRRRKARDEREPPDLVLLEDDPDTVALREPPITAV